MLIEGTFIHASLESAINTTLPGKIRALVNKNVYAKTGRNILIPKGSSLIGEYNSDVQHGQSRVFVMWSRVIRPDNVDALIGSYGTDNLGRSGAVGQVDTHFGKRFLTTALLTVLGGVTASLDTGTDSLKAIDAYQNRMAKSFEKSAAQSLERGTSIQDTHYIDQGTPMKIMLNTDVYFNPQEDYQKTLELA